MEKNRGWWGRASTGMLLVAGLAVVGGALLEAAAAAEAPAWLARGYLVAALVAVGAYWIAVFIPQRRLEKAFLQAQERYRAECSAVEECLVQLRMGDLVEAVNPTGPLPEAVEGPALAATQALSGLIQQIQTSSIEVAQAGAKVRETAAELASGSSQQAAGVVEITATMEELARTAGQIASNAGTQAELASQSEQAGEGGARAVEASVEGIEAVQQRMEAIAGRADTLGSRSREIYRVLDLINDISDETHILSLNAAIEAATAGEHGRRFSVVADEVRRLAGRSRESVDSVRALLDDFSDAIRSTVVATEEGSKAASHVLEQSRSTKSAIDQLRQALSDTAGAAREISLATEEQRGASDEVVLTLKQVSDVIQRMAEGLKRFSGTAQSLNQLALSIQLLTQSFRIDSPHSLKHQVLEAAVDLAEYAGNMEVMESRLNDVLNRAPYVEMAYLVDPTGAMMAYVVNREMVGDRELPGTVALDQSYPDRPWFQAVLREERPAVTAVYDSLLSEEQCFTVAAPVFTLEGELAAVLGVDVNVRHWTRI